MKLLHELGLKSMPDCHFGLSNAAVIADIRPHSILYNEAKQGRLRIFHPLPELKRVTFHSLAKWYEDRGQFLTEFFYQREPLLLRREPLIHHSQKGFAQICVQHALSIGLLKREPCVYCETEPAEAHHPEYSKPLWIIWLCKSHHSQHHSVRRALERKLVKEVS